MDIIFLLMTFLVVFGLCAWFAVRSDLDVERAEDDARGPVEVGSGWISYGWDGDVASATSRVDPIP